MTLVSSGKASPDGTIIRNSNTVTVGILDALVRSQLLFSLNKGYTPIGILSDSVTTWAWFVDGLGSLKWVAGPRNIPIRIGGDPPWFASYGNNLEREVGIVLTQGAWYYIPEEIWTSNSVRLILRVSSFVVNQKGMVQ